ncbi:NAD(P)-binding protein [Xylariomycetidae sp. FL0641]|nr:NAD(P)-binding protein [Xylariomycetidae sp. FL0641]
MASSAPHPLSAAELFNLRDYVAVVTGGGTGLGLMIAKTLAANGARVYITGRRAEVLDTSARVHGAPERLGPAGGKVLPLVMDVVDRESVSAAVKVLAEREGRVDVLVNNAGIFTGRPDAQPEDGPEKFGKAMWEHAAGNAWPAAFETNTTSVYAVTAAFLPLLAKASSGPAGRVGCVINNASCSGFHRTSQHQQYPYNISKAATIQLTRQMALDFSHDSINVRVNGLAPGYFPSVMTTQHADAENESQPDDKEFRGFMESLGAKVVKRMGTEKELASVVLTLATNEYMWGTTIVVDGGMTMALPGNL